MATRRNLLPDVWHSGSWNPMREMSRLQKDIDRLFDDFLSPENHLSNSEFERSVMFNPPCDIEETDTHFLMSFDLPGVSKDDVKIEVKENQLSISGERKEERKEEKKNRMSIERTYGSFQRSFALPASVNAEQVEAHFDNGILHIAVPKSEASKAKQIQIQEGKGGVFQKLLGNKEKEVKSEKAA